MPLSLSDYGRSSQPSWNILPWLENVCAVSVSEGGFAIPPLKTDQIASAFKIFSCDINSVLKFSDDKAIDLRPRLKRVQVSIKIGLPASLERVTQRTEPRQESLVDLEFVWAVIRIKRS